LLLHDIEIFSHIPAVESLIYSTSDLCAAGYLQKQLSMDYLALWILCDNKMTRNLE